MIQRLHEAISAVCPINGVSIVSPGVAEIDFADHATELQRNAANAALSTFDWSQVASDNWKKGKRRQNAIALLNSPEPSMVALRALARVVQSRMSVLLTALGRTPLSTAQLVSMWADEIANGQVDDSLPK